MAFERILIATDGSPGGDEALRLGADIARRTHAELIVMHAYERAPAFVAGFEQPMADDVNVALEASGAKALQQAEKRLAQEGIPARGVLAAGHPASSILDLAAAEDVDLIVLGHRGRGGTRFLLGSVADRVSNHASCAVLIAPPPAATSS